MRLDGRSTKLSSALNQDIALPHCGSMNDMDQVDAYDRFSLSRDDLLHSMNQKDLNRIVAKQ